MLVRWAFLLLLCKYVVKHLYRVRLSFRNTAPLPLAVFHIQAQNAGFRPLGSALYGKVHPGVGVDQYFPSKSPLAMAESIMSGHTDFFKSRRGM